MKNTALILIPLLAACAGQQSVSDAYVRAQQEKAKVLIACSQAGETTAVQGCMLGAAAVYGGGGNSDVVPVVQTPLQTILGSPVLAAVGGAAVNAVRDIKVAESNERTQIAIATANAQTEQVMFGAFRDTAQAGFNASTGIAQAGFDASRVGTLALASFSSDAVNAAAATALAVTQMPATYQVGGDMVGRDYVRDQSTTGGLRVQGNNNETARRVDCVTTAAPGGNVSATLIPSVSGTTNPLSTAYNAITGGNSAPATNTCGN